MKAERFEDLYVWQHGRSITNTVYSLFANNKDWGFRYQIQRAAVSIMNNIAEGFERRSNKEFSNFLSIAKGSCGEVRSMLYTALDLQYITENQFDQLYAECTDTSKKISALINSLKNQES